MIRGLLAMLALLILFGLVGTEDRRVEAEMAQMFGHYHPEYGYEPWWEAK